MCGYEFNFRDDYPPAATVCSAHHVIAEYDKRADVENLVGEAKREGLDAIPLKHLFLKSLTGYFFVVFSQISVNMF